MTPPPSRVCPMLSHCPCSLCLSLPALTMLGTQAKFWAVPSWAVTFTISGKFCLLGDTRDTRGSCLLKMGRHILVLL